MRAILDIVIYRPRPLQAGDHRRRGPVVADRVRRRQHPQRRRPFGLEPVPGADRAVPAPDPQLSAQHRRHRHFADHPVARASCWSSGSSSITSTPTCSERRHGRVRSKTAAGRFFEDFRLGETIRHATPRTLTGGDVSLYSALYGTRFAPQSAETFARAIGYPAQPDRRPARLPRRVRQDGARRLAQRRRQSRLRRLPLPRSRSIPATRCRRPREVIGLKENSNRQSGVVYVRSKGFNQRGETVLDYVRWVMVRKRDPDAPRPRPHVPDLPEAVAPAELGAACPPIDARGLRRRARGSPYRLERLFAAASGSTMSTASRSRRPSTRSRPASTRTPPRCISTSSARARAASGGG